MDKQNTQRKYNKINIIHRYIIQKKDKVRKKDTTKYSKSMSECVCSKTTTGTICDIFIIIIYEREG